MRKILFILIFSIALSSLIYSNDGDVPIQSTAFPKNDGAFPIARPENVGHADSTDGENTFPDGVRATTQSSSDNSTKLATTAYVDASGSSGIHADLTGLAADDHAQYILVTGTRPFTGDQSFGNNNITNVSTATATTFVGDLLGNADSASTITTIDESSDTVNYVGYFNASSGDQEIKTGTNLLFNASSGILTAFGVALQEIQAKGDAPIAMTLGSAAGSDFNIDSGTFVVEGDTKRVFIEDNFPELFFSSEGANADEKYLGVLVGGSSQFKIATYQDSLAGSYSVFTIDRNGAVPSYVSFPNGNVGIGTSTAGEKLEVIGTVKSEQLTSTDDADINDNLTVGDVIIDEAAGVLDFSGASSGTISASVSDFINITTSLAVDSDTFVVDGENNMVGIGTTEPDNLFAIFGSTPTIDIETSNTAIIAGDDVGTIQFRGLDTTELHKVGAMIKAEASDIWGGGVNDAPTELQFFTENNTTTTTLTTPRMTIDMDGNVGIGESSPSSTLEVKGTVEIFGTRVTKTMGVIYLAESDGIISAFINCYVNSSTRYLSLFVEADDITPDVLVMMAGGTTYAGLDFTQPGSLSFPVKKGEYYQVTRTDVAGAGAYTESVIWTPMGK